MTKIKTEELRLGNWVCSTKYHNGLNTEIFSILSSKVIKIRANAIANYDIKDISPIELTKEWIIKFGFIKEPMVDDIYKSPNYEIAYDFYDNRIKISDSWEFGFVFYVHQLQNLYFALTQTELTLS